MTARFDRAWAKASRANLLAKVDLLLASRSAFAAMATPEQRKARMPEIYRLCAGKIPGVRAITRLLWRQKASLGAGSVRAVRVMRVGI